MMLDQRHPVEQLTNWIDGVVYRNRHIVGPPALAIGLLAGATVAHLLHGLWAAAIIAAVVTWMGFGHAITLPALRERVYGCTCWVVAAGWVLLCTWAGPTRPMLIALVVALIVGGIPWAKHRRVRRGIQVDRDIEAWGDGSAVGLPGTQARGTHAGRDSMTMRISADVPGRYTIASYKQAVSRIAARFGVPGSAVSLSPIGREGEIEVTVREKPRDTVKYVVSREPQSIIGPQPVGTTDAGDSMDVSLYQRGHGVPGFLVQGATGSGKSGWINLMAERIVRAPDAVLCVIDLSPGAQELRDWAPACHWFASSVEEADRLIDWVIACCDNRGARSESRLFEPSEAEPLIYVLVDEAATLFAPDLLPSDADLGELTAARARASVRAKKVEVGVRVFRKYGVGWGESTQYADVAAVGGQIVKQQLASGYTAVFRTHANTDAHRLIGGSSGIRSGEIPMDKPGTLYLKGLTVPDTARGRIRYMSDGDIREMVAYWGDKQPVPEPQLQAIGGDSYINRQRAAPGDTGTRQVRDVPAADIPTGSAAPRRFASAEESRQHVRDVLASFPAGGTVGEIAERAERGLTMVQARLNELAAAGLAVAKGRKRPVWRAVPSSQ